MKSFLLVIVLVAIFGANVNAGFSGCEEQGQGYWADQDDCTWFHICYKMPGATTWTHIPMRCGVGKAFNSQYGFCSLDAVKNFC